MQDDTTHFSEKLWELIEEFIISKCSFRYHVLKGPKLDNWDWIDSDLEVDLYFCSIKFIYNFIY